MSLDRSTIQPYEQGEPGPLYYQRYGHAVGLQAERRLGELEGGRALLYASGSAASTGVALALLKPGDTIALQAGAYYGTGVLLRELGRWGLEVVEFDSLREEAPAGAALVWLEAPSNPHLAFPDVAAFTGRGNRVLVDATASTPVLFRPLEHGADLVLHSATKYLGGHHDVLLGAVAARDPSDHERLLAFRGLAGLTAAPDPAWLLLRSLPTLEVRVRRQSETALELARRLAGHEAVERVYYPGLEDEVAARYMEGGFGGMLSFEVRGDARAVESGVQRIENATSLGGVRSTIESRHRWEPERVSPGLLRLSVGLEDVDELWGDLERALEGR